MSSVHVYYLIVSVGKSLTLVEIKPMVQVGRWPMLKETSLIQVMVSSPVSVCPGLHFTSTSVPTITGKVVVVIMSDAAAGSSVHVSEEVKQSINRVMISIIGSLHTGGGSLENYVILSSF